MPRSRSIFIQSERVFMRSFLAFTSPASWIAPPKSKSFSVSVVLPASGCAIIAKVRRRATACLMSSAMSGFRWMAGYIATQAGYVEEGFLPCEAVERDRRRRWRGRRRPLRVGWSTVDRSLRDRHKNALAGLIIQDVGSRYSHDPDTLLCKPVIAALVMI